MVATFFAQASGPQTNKQINLNFRIKMGKSGHSAAEALLALSKPCKFGLAWRESSAMRSVSPQRQGKSLDVGPHWVSKLRSTFKSKSFEIRNRI